MPTVLRFEGFSVVIYSNDHLPAHVHVFGGGSEALFNLHCPDGPVSLRENYGFSRAAITRIRRQVDDNIAMHCGEWERIHG